MNTEPRDYAGSTVRYRCVVSAWKENSEDEFETRYHVERVVCVEVEAYPSETAYARAKAMAQAAMQLLYPKVNAFDVYNTVDEKESPAEVLGFVTGWAKGAQAYDAHPIVLFRTQHNPADFREPAAKSWDEIFAMVDEENKK